MTAADVTSPDGHATADSHADPSTGALEATASASAESPLPVHFGGMFFGEQGGYGSGTSMSQGWAYVTRSFDVDPGTYRVTVSLSGVTASAWAEGVDATSGTSTWLQLVPDLGGDIVRGYMSDKIVRVGTRRISVEDNIVNRHTLACAPAEPECSAPTTLTLEATIDAEETILVRVGLSAWAQTERGSANASGTATAGAISMTRLD